jgi:hypothetical protein
MNCLLIVMMAMIIMRQVDLPNEIKLELLCYTLTNAQLWLKASFATLAPASQFRVAS